ncbi:MAG: RsmD family RNA methyltransferase [Bacteroidota bacterium]|nr:RsmD family RNA methyltransferase [Bacteroidota bacterium]
MRIISGSHKGRIIKPPAGLKVRPTTDKARESLFNILNNILDLSDTRVLDLFAGTGSVSYEFASRGAILVHAVEANHRHAAFISNTATKLDMKCLQVFHTDVRKYLIRTANTYDLVFADPPYNLPWLAFIPDVVFSAAIMNPGGKFILEHPRDHSFNNHRLFEQHRKYGAVNFSFFKSEGNITGEDKKYRPD